MKCWKVNFNFNFPFRLNVKKEFYCVISKEWMNKSPIQWPLANIVTSTYRLRWRCFQKFYHRFLTKILKDRIWFRAERRRSNVRALICQTIISQKINPLFIYFHYFGYHKVG